MNMPSPRQVTGHHDTEVTDLADKRKRALVKVSVQNSFRINQIYSEICFRANPNSSESIRKKFSISFDVIRLKINPSQSESIRDFESE